MGLGIGLSFSTQLMIQLFNNIKCHLNIVLGAVASYAVLGYLSGETIDHRLTVQVVLRKWQSHLVKILVNSCWCVGLYYFSGPSWWISTNN